MIYIPLGERFTINKCPEFIWNKEKGKKKETFFPNETKAIKMIKNYVVRPLTVTCLDHTTKIQQESDHIFKLLCREAKPTTQTSSNRGRSHKSQSPRAGSSGLASEKDCDVVTKSMVAHEFLIVVHDVIDPELRNALFGLVLLEISGFLPEVKRQNASTTAPFRGYIFHVPDMNWDSMRIPNATFATPFGMFEGLLWPDQRNPAFW